MGEQIAGGCQSFSQLFTELGPCGSHSLRCWESFVNNPGKNSCLMRLIGSLDQDAVRGIREKWPDRNNIQKLKSIALGERNELQLREEDVEVILRLLACISRWVAVQSLNMGTLVWGHLEWERPSPQLLLINININLNIQGLRCL